MSKDGAVVQEFFGQVAASCLTILEMAVDDRCYHHLLIYLWSVGADFAAWSLNVTKITEFGLGFGSPDHKYAFSFKGVVSLDCIHVFLVER